MPITIEEAMIAVTAVKAGYEIYEGRGAAGGITSAIRRKLKAGHTTLAVLGAAGTGKSTFGRLLAGKTGNLSHYVSSREAEEYTFVEGAYGLLIVGPGQDRYWKTVWPHICDRMKSGKKHILINVVSYGYHAMEGKPFREHPAFQQGDNPSDFVKKYTALQRDVELDALKEIEPHLLTVKGDLHLITLITKQDMWWGQQSDVIRHYTEGDYHLILERIKAHHGGKNFHHDFHALSLVRLNFRSPDNVLLAKTAEGYDEAIFQVYMKQGLEAVNAKCNK